MTTEEFIYNTLQSCLMSVLLTELSGRLAAEKFPMYCALWTEVFNPGDMSCFILWSQSAERTLNGPVL